MDYDENTGEASTLSAGLKTAAQESVSGEDLIYRAIKATSVFSKGKFTQEIEGLLMDFPTSDTKAVNNVTFSNLSNLSGDNYLKARGIAAVDKTREIPGAMARPVPSVADYNGLSKDLSGYTDQEKVFINNAGRYLGEDEFNSTRRLTDLQINNREIDP